jgi:glyoxylase-like metal-dependent hydrolase (beta-lactamase superfamily II)
MRFIFEQVRVGGDRNFGYLLGDREAGEGVLVDPSFDPELMVARAQAQGLRITRILNTHGHSDHSNGNAAAKALTGAPVAGGPYNPGGLDQVLQDGDQVGFGAFSLRAWHVPGHCPDHLAFLLTEPVCTGLTGDLLFVGKVGGTGSDADARLEWASLRRLLRDWPAHTTLWPGHDYGARPSSTVAWERAANPFLLCPDVAAFIRLKADWPDFKARNGLK